MLNDHGVGVRGWVDDFQSNCQSNKECHDDTCSMTKELGGEGGGLLLADPCSMTKGGFVEDCQWHDPGSVTQMKGRGH